MGDRPTGFRASKLLLQQIVVTSLKPGPKGKTGWPFRALAASAAALVIVASACSTGSSGGMKDPHSLSVEVGSYDVAVGAVPRFTAGVFTADHRFVGYGTVQMRFRFVSEGTQHVSSSRWGPRREGTFLAVPGVSIAKVPKAPTVVSAQNGRGVYATQATFDRAGFWEVEVAAAVDGGEVRRARAAFQVLDRHKVPAPGDLAPASDNPTLASGDAPPAAIDSRATEGSIPDPELHQVSIANALAARRPVVIVFSTPEFCTSRMCGPVTDMVQQLADRFANRATFVHVEIWRDFDSQQVNPAATEWLASDGGDLREPWVFLVGADGRVAARWDNVTTRGEIEPLLQQLPVSGPET